MMSFRKWHFPLIAILGLTSPSAARALPVPFTEEFGGGVAGWEDSVNNPLGFETSGGVDDSSYASSSFNYFGYSSPFGGGPVTFRASASDGASGGAFIGDYLAAGVTAISAWFRHDAPEPLTPFARVATPANFPGAVVTQTEAIAANVWTEITFLIDVASPFCIGESVSCAAALANVGNLQFGTDAPAGLVDDDVAYTLDIDRVSLVPVPEPTTALLVGLGLLGLAVSGRGGADT